MAFYLKKTKLKGRTYLSIDESFYSHEKHGTAHKCFKSLGSVETWIQKGIPDPIAHFQKEVDALNLEKAQAGVPKISEVSPLHYLGYFPLKVLLEKMHIQKYVDYFKLTNDFSYDLYELLSSLIYARAVHPCSKYKTFHEVLPNLYDPVHFSYDQLLHGLAFLGNDYEKFIEIFTVRTNAFFKTDTSKTYFDCTNFYFEIDREDDFRKKGPSKENKKEPIVGLGLLLDGNQIPIGMKMYPGNESEKPVLRDVIDQLKAQHNITGKTIHVADKGLNCAKIAALAARAKALNSERMVLAAPGAVDDKGTALDGMRLAAAIAGAIAAESDPALPLSGAALFGLYGVSANYNDNEIDLLIQGGVTPVESVGGEISVVRGVTTRTKTGQEEDLTWRDLSTILIVDDVIPAVRGALRSRFQRSKNTEQSRGAIRSQVVLTLENKLSREIITGYDSVRVSVDPERPSVCLVDFSFTVAHGLNQIWLTAHITI